MFALFFAVALACAGAAITIRAADAAWAHEHQWLAPWLWAAAYLALMAAVASIRSVRLLLGKKNKGELGLDANVSNPIQQQANENSVTAAVGSIGNIGPGATVNIGNFSTHATPARPVRQPFEKLIEIRNLKSRQWPYEQHGFTGIEYFFEVFNSSTTTSVQGIEVEVFEMKPDPIGYLPAPLHMKHDDTWQVRKFDLNPQMGRNVDFITGPVVHPKSQRLVIVAHLVNRDRAPIPSGEYITTIRATAKNSLPATATFRSWMADDGSLKCETITS